MQQQTRQKQVQKVRRLSRHWGFSIQTRGWWWNLIHLLYITLTRPFLTDRVWTYCNTDQTFGPTPHPLTFNLLANIFHDPSENPSHKQVLLWSARTCMNPRIPVRTWNCVSLWQNLKKLKTTPLLDAVTRMLVKILRPHKSNISRSFQQAPTCLQSQASCWMRSVLEACAPHYRDFNEDVVH